MLPHSRSLLQTIQTKSEELPTNKVVDSDGDILYSDWSTKIIYEVMNEHSKEMIKLQGWTPINQCVTFTGELLVTICMFNDNQTQSKVVLKVT